MGALQPAGPFDGPCGERGERPAGQNGWQRTGYGGPCPPIGRHRYFFRLYALDIELADLGDVDKRRLLEAMEGHVLEQAELVGTYQKGDGAQET